MTPAHACTFFLIGLGMILSPALLPLHFGDDHLRSAVWLIFMGSLQATAGLAFLLAEGLRRGRRLAAAVGESLDFDLTLADVRRAVLPPSFYALIEGRDDVAVAWRLQRQLRRLRPTG